MLTEEAHHMFVGDNGIQRVIKRTLEVMNAIGSDDPAAVRRAGAIDLPTVQRYLNFWFSSSLDLFGAEMSSNAASYFATGIKGRPDEKRFADHVCVEGTLRIDTKAGIEEVPLRNAMNEVTRAAYIHDCENGVKRWSKVIAKAGQDFTITLPSARFRRGIGAWAGAPVDPAGHLMDAAEWQRRRAEWVPSPADKAFVKSLMVQVAEPGKMAGWIAPPDRGINEQPLDYDYVRLYPVNPVASPTPHFARIFRAFRQLSAAAFSFPSP
jgi:benzoyl-CoA 2,3-dioxygenase component B